MDTTTLASSAKVVGHHVIARASNDSNRGTDLFKILTVILIIAWITVLLRGYVRFFIIKHVAADDWWMFASMMAYTAYSIEAMYGILFGGTGRHMADLSTQQIYIGLKCWYISEILYAPISAMVRTSVALFLLRVSVDSYHKWIVLTNLSIIYLITIVFMFVVTFQCDPPSYFYDQVLGLEGHCMDITVVPYVTIAHSAVGAVCDLVFASLPIAFLWNVQLNKRTKFVVACLLGMGFVAGIALLVRIPFVKILSVSPDFLFETIDVAIWSVLEPSLGIIAGCLATMRPLLKDLGIGRNTSRGYFDEYGSASSRLAHFDNGQPNFRSKLSGDGTLPSQLDMELSSAGLRTNTGSSHSSTRPLSPPWEPLLIPKLSMNTGIMSNMDSTTTYHAKGSGPQSISVHTTIRTENTYEDIRPIKENE